MSGTISKNRRSADSFMELVQKFPLRPIRSVSEYAAAAAMLDRLALRDDKLDCGEADYLETLELLIEAYDEKHAAIRPSGRTPLERLKYLMKQNRMSSADLGDLIGSRPTATMILKGGRQISKAHIRKLVERFRVEAGLFL